MRIGLTAGVWDLFHDGHKNHLQKCKEYCDYLIVVVASDWNARIQKGHERPVQSAELRAQNTRLFPAVDKVLITDLFDLTEYLKIADIWFKGEQQKNNRPAEFANIIYIPYTPGISTTELIEGMGTKE